MNGIPDPPRSPADDEEDAWAESVPQADVPVLKVEDRVSPKAVLPTRRQPVATQRGPKAEEGLRIESRFSGDAPEESQKATPGTLEVVEIGRKIVKLEADPAGRDDSLPTMKPRRRLPRKAEDGNPVGPSVSSGTRWLVYSSAAVLVIVVAALIIDPMLADKRNETRVAGYEGMKVVDDIVDPDDPIVAFEDGTGDLLIRMNQVLAKYAGSRTLEDAIPLIRNGSDLRETLETNWKPWKVPPAWEPARDAIAEFSSVGKRPFARLFGDLPDFSPYEAYMVKEENRLLIDWEATTGAGSTTFAGAFDPALKQAVLRLEVDPSPFYTDIFPEERFDCYRMTRKDAGSQTLWGYAAKGQQASATLGKFFHAGPILAGNTAPVKVRVRLARSRDDARPNQWEIIDVLHKGWVSP